MGLIRATYDSFLEDDCPFAVSTHFLEHERVQSAIQETLRAYLPPRAHAVILENVREAIRLRGPVGVVAAFAYLWSSSAAVGAVRHTLNRIWDVKRSRPFWQRKLLEAGTTLALAGVLGALAIISVGLSILAGLGWRIPLSGRLHDLVLAGPAREAAALIAAVLFEVARHAAFWGLALFAQYQLVYGSMAGVVIFLLWTYVTATILLIGAEIARCRAPLSPAGE